MASINRIVLVGNLTRDPEIRNTQTGTSVANLGIAVNRQFTNKQGEREADFFNIVAWDKLADLCGQYLKKGSGVAIDGRLQSRTWDTKDGQRRTTVEVVADSVQFLNRAPATAETSTQETSKTAETSTQETSNTSETNQTEEVKASPPLEAQKEESKEEIDGDDIPF